MDRVFILDFDGVVADSLDAHGRLVFDYAERYHHNIPGRVNGVEIHVPADVPKAMKSPMTRVFEDFGFPKNRIDNLMADYRRDLGGKDYQLSRYPGVVEAVQSSGVKVGIATSNYRAVVERFLAREGINGTFNPVVGLEDIRNPKPHPESLMRCLQSIVPNDEDIVFYIGDQPCDMDAARRLDREIPNEVRSVAVGWGYNTLENLRKANPDYVAENPDDLTYLMKELML